MSEIDIDLKDGADQPAAAEPINVRSPMAEVEERSSVDNLLRTAQQNLVQLSVMADQKANIILGAAFIMITVIVGISSSSGLTASLAVLGGFTTMSAIVALMAVMPTIPKETRVDKTNPLYFGDIAQMSREDHERALASHLNSDDGVYRLIARDIHESASVLQHRKFKFLRISYWLFIIGLLCTTGTVLAEWLTGNI